MAVNLNQPSNSAPSKRDAPARLFVCGTPRGSCENPMACRLRRSSHSRQSARFQGVKYDLGAYPGVLPSVDVESLVAAHMGFLEHLFQIENRGSHSSRGADQEKDIKIQYGVIQDIFILIPEKRRCPEQK